jgi:GTP-binding protein
MAAKGGRGGLGNSHFATAVNQAPRYAQAGEKGKEGYFVLELKLLADVGLIGLPNAGKSTLISTISAVKPKIADYPFTTLSPNLGVVKVPGYRSFVAADIPGLIEGAHKGAGLGHQFLRHVERTALLLHLVDVSGVIESDPVDDLLMVDRELKLYSPGLVEKYQAVVGTKIDISGNNERLGRLAEYCRSNSLDFFAISAATGQGLDPLLKYLASRVGGKSWE